MSHLLKFISLEAFGLALLLLLPLKLSVAYDVAIDCDARNAHTLYLYHTYL